ICRTPTLVSNSVIDFKSVVPATDTWTGIILKGDQYEFNETVWGKTTRRYLEPIEALSDEQFKLIIEETQKYVKGKGKCVATMSSADSANKDDGGSTTFFPFVDHKLCCLISCMFIDSVLEFKSGHRDCSKGHLHHSSIHLENLLLSLSLDCI
ncbi:hypothetical protein PAXRUDRAFT_159024, partial [Paxillus rubicundulus Ve08.2h10]